MEFMSLVSLAGVWPNGSFVGQLIIFWILGMTGYAVYLGHRGLGGFESEEKWLGEARKDFVEQEQLLEASESAGTLDPLQLVREAGASSLIQQRIGAIKQLRARRVVVNLRLLQKLSVANLAARRELAMPARAAQMAMMLGILGTFWGLAQMVQEIEFAIPDPQNLSVESLTHGLESLTEVMAGIKTAFSTSLFGLAAAACLTWMAHRIDDRRATLLFHLEHFTVTQLLPALAPDMEDREMLDGVSRRMEDAFDSLEESFERNDQVLARLSGIHDSYLALVDQLRDLGRLESGQGWQQLADDVAQTNLSVLNIAENLPKVFDAIRSSQERFLERLNPWQQILSGLTNLWTARLPFGIPGSAVFLVLLLAGALVLRSFW